MTKEKKKLRINLVLQKELRMNILRFCPRSRKRMVEMRNEGKSVKEIALELNTSRQTVYLWLNRYDEKDKTNSLCDRKSIPKTRPRKTPKPLERLVIKLRDKHHWSSLKIHLYLKKKNVINPSTGKYLSEYAIRAIFERYKRGYKFDKKKNPKPKIIRYEKQIPGELVHIDVKKLQNVKGEDAKKKKYEAAIIDDCTRLSFARIIPDKKAKTLSLFFKDAYFYFEKNFNITIQSVMSDNGKEFTCHHEASKKFHNFELMCGMLKVKHIYTKIRCPQTNGKVERFWKTTDIELFKRIWFKSHEHRNREFKKFLYDYNYFRMHMGINGLTPIQKLKLCKAQLCKTA